MTAANGILYFKLMIAPIGVTVLYH